MKQKILGILLILMGVMGLVALTPTPVMASTCTESHPLGFRPWFQGLCDGEDLMKPPQSNEGMAGYFWTITLNLVFDVSLAVGYLAMGCVIWGGMQISMSQGDSGRYAKGKRTLTTALIGTVIAMSASVIVNTVRVILGMSGDSWKQFDGSGFQQAQILDAFNWAYTIAGTIAVVYILVSVMNYFTSEGDPSKAHKATTGIIYAVAGLVIVLLAAGITAVVMEAVGGKL